jgi:hypothetical protein
VISVMDGAVAEYEASLVSHPRVPARADDPYLPPPGGSGDPVAAYARTDRQQPGPRSDALPDPNFSGTSPWVDRAIRSRSRRHAGTAIGSSSRPAAAFAIRGAATGTRTRSRGRSGSNPRAQRPGSRPWWSRRLAARHSVAPPPPIERSTSGDTDSSRTRTVRGNPGTPGRRHAY